MELRYKVSMITSIVLFAAIVTYYGAPEPEKIPKLLGGTFHKIVKELLNSGDLGQLSPELHALYEPIIVPITAPAFDINGTSYTIENTYWTESLGRDLCIADVDTRDFDHDGQILSQNFSWAVTDTLSAGMLSHYLYASIHGYTYHFVQPEIWPNNERWNVWTKIPKLRKLLDVCRVVLMIDSDVVFQHPELPFEWLLNRWNFTHDTSMALPWDVYKYLDATTGEVYLENPGAYDAQGMLSMNAGVVVAQSSPRTKAMVDAWVECPDNATRFPGCDHYCCGWPAEQGAFNEYVRHEFNETNDLQPIACDEANGYPGQNMNCSGVFLRHFTGDKSQVKPSVAQVLLEDLSYIFTKQFHRHEEGSQPSPGK